MGPKNDHKIEHKVDVSGQSVHYTKAGKGKPLFMLHGWGGSTESWEPLTEHVDTKKHQVYALDMPGFGKSAKPKKAWTVEDYAQFFNKFVQKMYTKDKLKGNFDVVVHSFGGRVITKYMGKQIGKSPTKLVLIGAAGIKHPRTLKKKILQGVAKCGGAIFSLPGLKLFKRTAQKMMYKILRVHDYKNTSGVMRKTFLNVIDEDLTGLLEHINCPTLILWGKNDTYVPVKDAHTMNELIPHSELKVLADGRHGIHKTHAEKLGGWINTFLSAKV